MTSTIIYFDPRFGGASKQLFTVPDAVASAFVRSGTAAAADPAQTGALSAGVPLDPGTPTQIVLVNGVPGLLQTTQVTVPLSVALVAAAQGVGAPVGGSLGTPPPALTNLPQSSSLVARWSADTITGLPDGTPVSSWTDTINGLQLTQGTVGKQPAFAAAAGSNRAEVRCAGGQVLGAVLSGTALKAVLDSGNYTILAIVRNVNTDGAGGSLATILNTYGGNGGDGIWLKATGARMGVNFSPFSSPEMSVPFTAAGLATLGITASTSYPFNGSPSNCFRTYVQGGCLETAITSSPALTTQGGDLAVGGFTGGFSLGYFSGGIIEILAWNKALTPAEMITVQRYAADLSKVAYPWAAAGAFTVISGNSIPAGLFATAIEYTVPARVAATLNLPVGAWSNLAISSAAVSGLDAAAGADIDPIAAASGVRTRLGFLEWYNQEIHGPANTAEIATRTYIANRKAANANIKIALATSIDTASSEAASHLTARGTFNANLTANFAPADALVATHTNALIGQAGAASADNGTYFQPDKVHLIGAAGTCGASVLAGLFGPALGGL